MLVAVSTVGHGENRLVENQSKSATGRVPCIVEGILPFITLYEEKGRRVAIFGQNYGRHTANTGPTSDTMARFILYGEARLYRKSTVGGISQTRFIRCSGNFSENRYENPRVNLQS